MKKLFLTIATALITIAWFTATPVLAREDYFKPAIGEVLPVVAGLERAVSLNEGGLMLYQENGKAVKGFPLRIPGRVVASSPLIADVLGDTQKEIVFLTRNGAGTVYLDAYNGAGAQLAEVAVAGSVYYDPQELRVPGAAARDVLVTTLTGAVVDYHYQAGTFVPTALLSLGKTAGATPDSTGKELDVIFPGTKQIAVYTKGTTSWALAKTIVLASPLLFSVTRTATGTIVYGVAADNSLVAYDTVTGQAVTGFPVALPKAPLDSPVIADIDPAQPGSELIVPVSGGNSVVVSSVGTIITKKFASKSLLEKAIAASDAVHNGLYTAVRNYGSAVVQKNTKQVVSPFSLGQFTVTNVGSAGHISVSAGGNVVGNGGGYDIGSIELGVTPQLTFAVNNSSTSNLQLTGTPLVNILGDTFHEFNVITQPGAFVVAGSSTTFTVQFAPMVTGTKNIELHIANSDPAESDFTISLTATSVLNGFVVADAEDNKPNRFILGYATSSVISSLQIVPDDAAHAHAYDFHISNHGWYYGVSPDTSVPAWDVNTYPVVQWEAQVTSSAMFLLTLNTNQGGKYLYYSLKDFCYTGRTCLSSDYLDGKWHTYSINVLKDLAARYPGAVITQVISFRFTTNGRLDNLRFLKNGSLAQVSGIAVDDVGNPVVGATLSFQPLGQTVTTDATGHFTMLSLPAGLYTVGVTKPFFAPTSTAPVLISPTDTNVSLTVHLAPVNNINIADAHNNDANRFALAYPSTSVTSSIQVVSDPVMGSAYSYAVSNPGWYYYIAPDAAVPSWDVSSNRTTMAWDVKPGSDSVYLITLNTDQGSKYMFYSTKYTSTYASNSYTGVYQLPSSFTDGQWHSVSRDLLADLKSLFPTVTKVNYIVNFRFTGHAQLTNLRLQKGA